MYKRENIYIYSWCIYVLTSIYKLTGEPQFVNWVGFGTLDLATTKSVESQMSTSANINY